MTDTLRPGTMVLDHLVILARSLDEGVAWCEATLGITPSAGGSHPKMGTHNRLFAIASDRHPGTYAEILAIDRTATAPDRRRWFDADDPSLQDAVARQPRLIAYAARTGDLAHTRANFVARGLDPGPAVGASRVTPSGLLEWQITIPDDGRRLLDGTVPTLIQWGAVHPTDALPACGVSLTALRLAHPRAAELGELFATVGLAGLDVTVGPPRLTAVLETPRGPVTLSSLSG